MKLRFWLVIIFICLIISSCNTSNKVVSSGFIQKRKYNKGYHIEWLANKGNSHSSNTRKEKLLARENQTLKVLKTLKVSEIKDSSNSSKTFIPKKENEKLMASIDNGVGFIYHPNAFIIQENDSLQSKNSDIDPNKVKEKQFSLKWGIISTCIGLIGIYLRNHLSSSFGLLFANFLFTFIFLGIILLIEYLSIEKSNNRTTYTLPLVDFILSVIGLACSVIMFFSPALLNSSIGSVALDILLTGFLVGLVAGLFLSLIAFMQKKNNPAIYKGIGYAIASAWISLLSFITFITALLLFVSFSD